MAQRISPSGFCGNASNFGGDSALGCAVAGEVKGPKAIRTDRRPAAATMRRRERLIFPSVARDTVRPVAPDLSSGRRASQWADGRTGSGRITSRKTIGNLSKPPVVESPPVFVQQEPTQGYWYFCPSSQTYYPNVPSCPEAWVKVPPRSQ